MKIKTRDCKTVAVKGNNNNYNEEGWRKNPKTSIIAQIVKPWE